MILSGKKGLRGTVTVPGDKSISHRAVMFGSIAKGETEITNFLKGADCLATIDCFRKMGVKIEESNDKIIVHGKGPDGLVAPTEPLNVGNSGTTTRLIAGILAGQSFPTLLSGDDSLNSRPMGRIIEPLSLMGCSIESVRQNGCAPLRISGGALHGIHYTSKVASAQIKSAVLLAGLYAQGETSVTEPILSRNHTELMLKGFGADILSVAHEDESVTVTLYPGKELRGLPVRVPGDISSAAYFIAAALLVPDSELVIKNVGINPTRAGIIQVFRDMGGKIEFLNLSLEGGEPTADLLVKSSRLHGTTIEGSIIPTLIDEIPMIAVAAALAEGETIIRDAAELKVKETNRIDTTVEGLLAMGANVTPTDDGMKILGTGKLHGASIESHLDHRIAMAFSIAGLTADGTTTIRNGKCVDISYPEFYETLKACYK